MVIKSYEKFLISVPCTALDKRSILSLLNAKKAVINLKYLLKLFKTTLGSDTMIFKTFLNTTIIQSLITDLGTTTTITPGRTYQLILVMIRCLHFLSLFCHNNGVQMKASSMATWDLLKNAARNARNLENIRIAAKRFHGPEQENTLTQNDLKILYQKTFAWMKAKNVPWVKSKKIGPAQIRHYLAHLITAILVSTPPPRVQIFKKLEVNKTLKWDGEKYSFAFDGLNPVLKSKKPLLLILPSELTEPMANWMTFYRPLIVGESNITLVFPNATGSGPRKDWSALTNYVTNRYLAKSIAPSKFR